jgi:sigma-B regulation protein RsbU (phosphoserine phosphatase)
VDLDPGSLLMIYTDGIPEAENAGTFFGVERIEKRLLGAEDARCEAVARSILDDVEAFLGPSRSRADDVTLVLLRREGEAAGNGASGEVSP